MEGLNNVEEQLRELEHNSLVSFVCTQLQNHFYINDKDLAEYVIHLAIKYRSYKKFTKKLKKKAAVEWQETFVRNLLALIHRSKQPAAGGKAAAVAGGSSAGDAKRRQFPGLCMHDDVSYAQSLIQDKNPAVAKVSKAALVEGIVEQEDNNGKLDHMMSMFTGILSKSKSDASNEKAQKLKSFHWGW